MTSLSFVVGKKKNLAILDILINAYRNGDIDDNGIREEVDNFIHGVRNNLSRYGKLRNPFCTQDYDTIAAAMCFSILCLADHPEIQVMST